VIERFLPHLAAFDVCNLLGCQGHPLAQAKAGDDVEVHTERERAVEVDVATVGAALLLGDLRDEGHSARL